MVLDVSVTFTDTMISPPVHCTLEEELFPSGSVQFRDTEDVVISVTVRFLTISGSVSDREVDAKEKR